MAVFVDKTIYPEPFNKEKKFCPYCGIKLDQGSRFCQNCGEAIAEMDLEQSESETEKTFNRKSDERQTVYEGSIHKCPNCGEVLAAFLSTCPTCGYEIRDAANSVAVQEFAIKLEKANSRQGKMAVIRNFPIPNTKEDVFEFLILASSNVGNDLDNDISDAWQSKVDQAYQKAQLIFKNKDELAYIQNIYNQVIDKLVKARRIRNIKKVNFFISEITPYLPNIIVVVGWLMSIFALLPLCKINLDNVGTNAYQLLLMLDMIAGTFFIPFTCRCEYSLPEAITSLGLILSIIILIPLCNKNLDNVGSNAFQLILIVDIICSIVIFKKIFMRKRKIKNKPTFLNGVSGIITLICVLIFLFVYGISSFFASNC